MTVIRPFRSFVCAAMLSAGTACVAGIAAPLSAQIPRPAGPEPKIKMPPAAELLASIDSAVTEQMSTSHIPGAVLIIVKDGVVYAQRGWGVTSLDAKTPATPERSIFRIGSISKVFTATSIMQLADRGKLKLDADVNTYLTDWKIPATFPEPIRLRNLLTHTGGLDEINPGRKTNDPTQVKPLGVFLRDRTIPVRAPGLAASYSTYGVSLMGYITELVSGMSLRDYLQQNVFGPLGMTRTTLGAPRESERGDVAVGYQYIIGRQRAADWEYFHTYPASDVNATAEDMGRFMIAHLDAELGKSPLLSESGARTMHTVQFRNHPAMIGFTYGFFEKRVRGYRAIQHSGSMDGFSAGMWLWPEQRMGLFVAYNRETPDLEQRIMRRFGARVLVPRRDTLDMEGVAWTQPLIKDDLKRFTGRFRLDMWCHSCKGNRGYVPAPIDVTIADDSTLSIFGGRWVQVAPLLFRITNGQLDTGEMYVAFVADSAGRITKLISGTNVKVRE